ncbi:M56 family metallopeptidase [Paenibacillus sp. CECT 9249]|uniref:M56 family metallopeptidase n=1 Tax=Paenibacillus sp. CECT 9249 TaxID=2845385 RepID=UPI0033B4662E
MCCLLALHWFNPILWYAYYRMRADREIACDALVLSRIRPGESGAYGHAMIKLLEDVSELSRQPFTASFSGSKKQLQRRIAMIAKYRPQTFRWSAARGTASLPIARLRRIDPFRAGGARHCPIQGRQRPIIQERPYRVRA